MCWIHPSQPLVLKDSVTETVLTPLQDEWGCKSQVRVFHSMSFGLGVTQVTSPPLVLPWVGRENLHTALPGPLCSPLQVPNAKLAQAGTSCSGQEGNPNTMLILSQILSLCPISPCKVLGLHQAMLRIALQTHS